VPTGRARRRAQVIEDVSLQAEGADDYERKLTQLRREEELIHEEAREAAALLRAELPTLQAGQARVLPLPYQRRAPARWPCSALGAGLSGSPGAAARADGAAHDGRGGRGGGRARGNRGCNGGPPAAEGRERGGARVQAGRRQGGAHAQGHQARPHLTRRTRTAFGSRPARAPACPRRPRPG